MEIILEIELLDSSDSVLPKEEVNLQEGEVKQPHTQPLVGKEQAEPSSAEASEASLYEAG